MPLKVYTKIFGAPPSFHCSKNYNLNLSAEHRDAPKKTTAKVAAVVMKICYVLKVERRGIRTTQSKSRYDKAEGVARAINLLLSAQPPYYEQCTLFADNAEHAMACWFWDCGWELAHKHTDTKTKRMTFVIRSAL